MMLCRWLLYEEIVHKLLFDDLKKLEFCFNLLQFSFSKFIRFQVQGTGYILSICIENIKKGSLTH